MSTRLVILLVLCVFGIASGQLLFKLAATESLKTPGIQGWISNGWLWAALVLYGGMTLLWMWVLRQAPLHVAYPFMGLAFLFVPLLARVLLGEPLTWQALAGGALILCGVALASSGGSA